MENQSSISDLLVSAFDNLLQDDFKRFRDKLSHSDFKGKGTIPRGQLENADKIDTKNLLMKFYGAETAVDVTVDVFIQLNLRDAAEKLREEREKGKKPKVLKTQGSLPQGSRRRRRNWLMAGVTNSESQLEMRGTQIRDAHTRFSDLLHSLFTTQPAQGEHRKPILSKIHAYHQFLLTKLKKI
uniref:Pyrin domain-containing protein n=1 Tax=Terrapene triunguis TaxID=2587831 RepID=A0A674JJJ8_9SAUR